MKRVFFSICLLLSSVIARAEIPNNFTVVTSQPPGGTIDVTCRKLFELYNKIHSSNSVILNRVGGYGAVAQREVVSSNKFTVGCSAGPEHWANPFLYTMPDADKIKVVTQIAAMTDFYYTGAKNSAQNFAELIENARRDNKTIAIGGFSGHTTRMEYILRLNNVKYTVIPYQKMSDMTPSLIDGTLDIGIDGGTLMPLTVENKIKLVGYSNRRDWAHLQVRNYLKQYPGLLPWLPTMALYMSKDVSSSQFEEFAQRITRIIHSVEFNEWAATRDLTPLGETPKQAEEVMETARQTFINFTKSK